MRRALAAAVAAVLASGPAAGRELWRSGEASLEFSGTLRELVVGTHGTSIDRFARGARRDPADCVLAATFHRCDGFDAVNDAAVVTSLTRLRTRFDLRLNEHLSAVVAYDHELLGGSLDTFEVGLREDVATSSWLDLEGTLVEGDDVEWTHLLYRGYVFIETERVELVLGRQRIPWGVGRLWNPIDRFNAIPPLELQADESVGVDAATARWLFSGFTFLEAVVAPQDHFDDSAAALRLHGVLRDVDYSLVAGVFDEAWTAGMDLAGNVGGSAARLELVYTVPTRAYREIGQGRANDVDPFWQVVVSIDHLFDVGTGLYALLEHLYNGNALGFGRGKAGVFLPFFQETNRPPPGLPAGPAYATSGNVDRFGGSRVITGAENQTGAQLGYDVTPEIRAELVSIYDWNGWSASFFPSLHYSPTDWLELTLGGQFFVGPRRSQYGNAEPLGFLLADFFF